MHYFGFLPMEVRPDIGTTLAAHLADEQRFDIGQPDLIGPRVGAEGPMGAFIIRAIRSAARERLMRALRRA